MPMKPSSKQTIKLADGLTGRHRIRFAMTCHLTYRERLKPIQRINYKIRIAIQQMGSTSLFAGSRHRILTIVGIGTTISVLFLLLMLDHLDYLNSNYIEADRASSGTVIRIAMNAIPAAAFVFFNKRFVLDQQDRSFWLWWAWSAFLFIPLFVLSSSTAIDRVALYWIPFQLVIWSRLPDAFGVPSVETIFQYI